MPSKLIEGSCGRRARCNCSCLITDSCDQRSLHTDFAALPLRLGQFAVGESTPAVLHTANECGHGSKCAEDHDDPSRVGALGQAQINDLFLPNRDLLDMLRHPSVELGDWPEIVGHDHRGDDSLTSLEVRCQANVTFRFLPLCEVLQIDLAEIANGGKGIHPIRHLLRADLVVWRDEGCEGRVSHKPCPPALRLVWDAFTRGVGGIELQIVSICKPVWRGCVYEASTRLSAITSGAGRILDNNPIQEALCPEFGLGVNLAVPVVDCHVVRLLSVQDVVHCHPPRRAAGVSTEGAKASARLSASAAL
mmetsp:Transcript_62094/g.161028  ORF Transcript_62094/g.161028 Transcript_62094/m.161028 type:complete len:306 (-) Transcript_62094:726-1643(-)